MLMAVNFDSDVAFDLVRVLVGIGLFIETAEYLSIITSFGAGGIFSWKVFNAIYLQQGARGQSLLDYVFGQQGMRALFLARAVSVLWLFWPGLAPAQYIVPLIVAFSVGCALNYRTAMGGDGSDQMNSIVLAGLASYALLSQSPRWQPIGLWFISLQSCLAYAASGIAKLASPVWRGGTAPSAILNTVTYGHAPAARFLARHRLSGVVAAWGVIIFEVAFVLCLIAPPKLVIWFLVLGATFHIANAVFMGLNVFFWSYIATYPAILYCNGIIRDVLIR